MQALFLPAEFARAECEGGHSKRLCRLVLLGPAEAAQLAVSSPQPECHGPATLVTRQSAVNLAAPVRLDAVQLPESMWLALC